MAHGTAKLMITTYSRTDGTACICVCNFARITRKAVHNGKWILHLDYRDEFEWLQICPSDCPDLKLGAYNARVLLYNWKMSKALSCF